MKTSSQNKLMFVILIIVVLMINIAGLVIVLRDSEQANVLGVKTKEQYIVEVLTPNSSTAIKDLIAENEVFKLAEGEIFINNSNFIISGLAPLELKLNENKISVTEGSLYIVTKNNYTVEFENLSLSMVTNSQVNIDSENKSIRVINGLLIWNGELVLKDEVIKWEIDTWKISNPIN
jgi:hypothetical protein